MTFVGSDAAVARQGPLFFLHVHKTAGTSLREILRRSAPTAFCDARTWPELFALGTEELDRFEVFAAHVGPAISELLPRPPRFLTLLREPLARALSHFHQIRRNPEHVLHARLVAESWDFEAMLDDPEGATYLCDYQTRFLGSDFDVRRVRREVAPARWAAETVRLSRLRPLAADGEIALERACRRVEAFDFCGISEWFPAALALLERRLGLLPTTDPPRLNALDEESRSTLANGLSARSRDRFAERNERDAVLYHHAREIFRRRFEASFGASPEDFGRR